MRPEIPQTLKNTVIQLYLQGLSRNEIASRTGISQGGVSNIIATWKTALGSPLADDLRELSMALKRLGINTQQCATGFRLAKMIQDLGVDEDSFRTFISQIYQHCSGIGLRPQKVADIVKQLLKLSESIPLFEYSTVHSR
ncbi:MAG: helix-turn-helix domain containing protein [Thermoproteota archaeon]|nr:helix-turn-helix domain containing protein [Thermoproteota archaeon]